MNNKRSPYNKKSEMSKFLIRYFSEYPDVSVSALAKGMNRSIAYVRYLKGVANGNN